MCTECHTSFSSKRIPAHLQEVIFKKYVYTRYILSDLAKLYQHSIPWVRKQIFEYKPSYKAHHPRKVNLICDATFYVKRMDKLGTLVFKDSISKEDLIKKIMYKLTSTNETIFTKKLDEWYEIHKDFLAEKTLNESTGKEYSTHAKLVSAYKSLRTNLAYLFTHKKYKQMKIQNTTNGLDGGVFSPMKKLLKIHNGFTKSLKLKMVDDYLLNYKKK